jgi:hypothetical protein
MIGI